MKILKYSGLTVLNISLFFILLFTSVQMISTWNAYYKWHYNAHNIEATTHMDETNFMDVFDKMMDYLMNRRDSLDMEAVIDGEWQEVFGVREKAHMLDVKHLFVGARMIRNYSLIILCVFIIISAIFKPQWVFEWLHTLKLFFVIAFLSIGILGSMFYFNFNKYFIIFHELFFDNDLWILDPRTDILINMVPEIFFFQTSMLIILLFIVMVITTMIIRKIVMRKMLKNWRA